jgi:hypothetical protein
MVSPHILIFFVCFIAIMEYNIIPQSKFYNVSRLTVGWQVKATTMGSAQRQRPPAGGLNFMPKDREGESTSVLNGRGCERM